MKRIPKSVRALSSGVLAGGVMTRVATRAVSEARQAQVARARGFGVDLSRMAVVHVPAHRTGRA